MGKLFVTGIVALASAGCGTQPTMASHIIDDRQACYCELQSQWADCLDMPRKSCSSYLDTLDGVCELQVDWGGVTREECVEREIEHWVIALERSLPCNDEAVCR